MDQTATIAGHVASMSFDDLPADVVVKAKQVILDQLGVCLRASISKGASRIIIDFVSEHGAPGRCAVIGTGLELEPISTALANGTLGHDIIELDDVHGPSLTHAASVVVPAALAAAQAAGADGKTLIAAVVAGYDTEGRLGVALDPSDIFDRGFHPTSVLGCFGAASAAARSLGLEADRVRHALGLAGSQASGLLAWRDEEQHMTKSFQTGIAARDGVTAAFLAQRGFRSAPRIFDGPHNLFHAFSEREPSPELTRDLGTRFEIMRTGLKSNSCCRVIHAPLEALLSIMDREKLAAADLDRVVVRLAETLAPAVDGNPLITHNAQEVMAGAAHDRATVTLMTPYAEHRISDERVSALAERIEVVGDPELETLLDEHPAGPAIVEVTARDGREFLEQVNDPKGEPSRPLTRRDLEEKFRTLATPVVGVGIADRIVEAVDKLEQSDDVRKLSPLLSAPRSRRGTA